MTPTQSKDLFQNRFLFFSEGAGFLCPNGSFCGRFRALPSGTRKDTPCGGEQGQNVLCALCRLHFQSLIQARINHYREPFSVNLGACT